jgi:hypothetical protein
MKRKTKVEGVSNKTNSHSDENFAEDGAGRCRQAVNGAGKLAGRDSRVTPAIGGLFSFDA